MSIGFCFLGTGLAIKDIEEMSEEQRALVYAREDGNFYVDIPMEEFNKLGPVKFETPPWKAR